MFWFGFFYPFLLKNVSYVPLMHERIICILTFWHGVEFGYVSEDTQARLIGVSKLSRVNSNNNSTARHKPCCYVSFMSQDVPFLFFLPDFFPPCCVPSPSLMISLQLTPGYLLWSGRNKRHISCDCVIWWCEYSRFNSDRVGPCSSAIKSYQIHRFLSVLFHSASVLVYAAPAKPQQQVQLKAEIRRRRAVSFMAYMPVLVSVLFVFVKLSISVT